MCVDERADQALDLMAEKIGAAWSTPIRMLGQNGVTRYILLHLTNHEQGRDLMKDCMWKVCGVAEGGFYAHKGNQQFLISTKPDLKLCEAWVLDQLASGPERWQALHERVRPEIWKQTHVTKAVQALRRNGAIIASDYEGRFSAKQNPLLALP